VVSLRDPGPEVTLAPSGCPPRTVRWGHGWQIGTPAYWITLTTAEPPRQHQLGGCLAEEIAACLLGGHGMPHQMGLAAFERVRSLLGTADRIEPALRGLHYRFPAQKAVYLTAALAALKSGRPPSAARELRDWLRHLPGIGPKTASWIVRNHLGSGEVAIIDIHILRAGIRAGVFGPSWTPVRHYALLEAMFLAWAAHGHVSAADLDATIWSGLTRARSRGRGPPTPGPPPRPASRSRPQPRRCRPRQLRSPPA
jgi:N-glycosylase/DNA lyase